jgi:hypothetical protein
MVYEKVKPIPPKIIPPASGGEAAKSMADPSSLVVPPPTASLSVITSINPQTSFKTSLATIPDLMTSLPSFSPPSGTGMSHGTSGGGADQSNPFGSSPVSGVPGLIGELYDLKQTPDGTPTPIAIVPPEEVAHISSQWTKLPATAAGLKVLRDYVRGWDQNILDNYYKSPAPLETTQIFIPLHASEDATKAFHVQDKVTARRWIVHYHANVLAPKDGRYRFLGYGDDFLVVRWDGRNVLDGSISNEYLDKSANNGTETVPGPNGHVLVCGKWFSTAAGVAVPIDILIGEGPGGSSGFILLIEEEGDTSSPGDYPVFQVAPGTVPTIKTVTSPFSGKTLVFPAQ